MLRSNSSRINIKLLLHNVCAVWNEGDQTMHDGVDVCHLSSYALKVCICDVSESVKVLSHPGRSQFLNTVVQHQSEVVDSVFSGHGESF